MLTNDELKTVDFIYEQYMSQKPFCVYENYVENCGLYAIEIYKPKENPEDKTYLTDNLDKIQKFFNDGYAQAGLGSFESCRDQKDFKRNTSLLKVARCVANGVILAMCIYSTRKINSIPMGIKCVGATIIATQDKELKTLAKDALVNIIRSDVKLFDEFYWIEASGAIEHWWQTNGGVMIPNSFVPMFLTAKQLENFVPSKEDPYHYTRSMANTDITFNKVIFGVATQEIMDKYLKETNQTLFEVKKRIEQQQLLSSLKEEYPAYLYTTKFSKYILWVDYFWRRVTEDKVITFTQVEHNIVAKCYKDLIEIQKQLNGLMTSQDLKAITNATDKAQFVLEIVEVMVIHKFEDGTSWMETF